MALGVRHYTPFDELNTVCRLLRSLTQSQAGSGCLC